MEAQAHAQRNFESDVQPQVLEAAEAQARRETTPVLNTPPANPRYSALTALEPSTAELRKGSARKREAQHAAWHAQRALEPTLDALFTPDREPEPVDTRTDPAVPMPHTMAAADPLAGLVHRLGIGEDSLLAAMARTAQREIALGGQAPLDAIRMARP